MCNGNQLEIKIIIFCVTALDVLTSVSFSLMFILH